MNTSQKKDNRKFRNKKQNYNITNLYRYEDYFNDSKDFLKLMNDIPFLNGGLFECLDKKDKANPDKVLRIDGFSDRDDNPLSFPNYLFFSEEKIIDLSKIYDDRKKQKEKFRGLIEILNHYKFTIHENTPIEEEVALDPELLGKVFENLLASYNPETKNTARNQTGSFYTPREIVDYMVTESLSTYLENSLKNTIEEKQDLALSDKVRHLLSYTDEKHKFTDDETIELIKALDSCKIIDPACGSGAFPMGILHKMVYILGKLDPNNEKWKQKQIDKISEITDPNIKETFLNDIEEAFEHNELDYGRKLYLIENCIFGVDIQPIAVQISKLRVFISLVIDQRTNNNKTNLGIRPLPNLETKFVAGDSLVGIEKPEQLTFSNPEIDIKKEELKKIREQHFSARTPKTKNKYREEDEKTRNTIAELLKNDGFDFDSTKILSSWNPYDQNAKASFFDMEWMFGIKDPSTSYGQSGFDIVIGNPPYVQIQGFKPEQKQLWKEQKYQTYESTGDIYCLFYEQGNNLLKDKGILCYITSNKWMRANYGESTRKYFSENTNPLVLIDFSQNLVFESAIVHSNILIFEKGKRKFIEQGALVPCNDTLERIPNDSSSANISTIQENKNSSNSNKGLSSVNDINNKALKHLVQENTNVEKPYHITWVTHNSRISERMIEFKVKKGDALILNEQQEIEITKYILDIVKEKNFKVIAYNICQDHVHIILNCKKSELDNIVCTLKSKSTYLYKKNHKISDLVNIWAQKYNCSYIETEEKFYNTIEYVKNNRKKHNLSENKELLTLIEQGALVPCNDTLERIPNDSSSANISTIQENKNSSNSNKGLKKDSLSAHLVQENRTIACSIQKNFSKKTNLFEYINKNAVILNNLNSDIWNILTLDEYNIKNKVTQVGIPLKDWGIEIYRGILTGFNEAFIIDGKEKSELIKADPKNAEIIKPILRGRDVRKYYANFSDLWLINTHNGIRDKSKRIYVENDYPTIFSYLSQFKTQLEKRLDKGEHWSNLRNCAYLEDLDREKIVFSEIVSEPQFHLDKKGYYPEATTFFISGKNLKYLIALLNSAPVTYFFTKFYSGGELVGKYRYKKAFLENLPIPKISEKDQKPYEYMVDFVIFAKENGFETEANTIESVIDGMVYDLYFPEEMKNEDCYITDRVKEKISPFKKDDTDDFKKEYIKALNKFFLNDKIIYRGLIYRRYIDVVKIINGKNNE